MSWAEVFKINSNMDHPLDEEIGLKDDVASATGSLHAKCKKINDNLSVLFSTLGNSVIKSIQNGTSSASTGGTAVTISAVTLAKSIIIVSVASRWDDGDTSPTDGAVGAYVVFTSTTQIKCYKETNEAGGNVMVAWQVIEFY